VGECGRAVYIGGLLVNDAKLEYGTKASFMVSSDEIAIVFGQGNFMVSKQGVRGVAIACSGVLRALKLMSGTKLEARVEDGVIFAKLPKRDGEE